MKKIVLNLETLTCPSCLQKINNGLKALKGVNKDSVEVLFNSSRVRLEFDENVTNEEEIKNVIERLGYPVLKSRLV